MEKNLVQAYSWANIARYNGEDITELFEHLTTEMTMEEITEAQSLSKRCLESDYTHCSM